MQGAFAEHGQMLDLLDVPHFEIRKREDLGRPFDALILPGGESTVIGKLLDESGMTGPVAARIQSGMPVFGTCAGLILLAEEVEGSPASHGTLGTMSIRVKRNAYGRQLGSFHAEEEFQGVGKVPMTFIRAPYIENVYGNAVALAKVDGKIVAARQQKQLVCAFHPEVTQDVRIHQYFLNMCVAG